MATQHDIHALVQERDKLIRELRRKEGMVDGLNFAIDVLKELVKQDHEDDRDRT